MAASVVSPLPRKFSQNARRRPMARDFLGSTPRNPKCRALEREVSEGIAGSHGGLFGRFTCLNRHRESGGDGGSIPDLREERFFRPVLVEPVERGVGVSNVIARCVSRDDGCLP